MRSDHAQINGRVGFHPVRPRARVTPLHSQVVPRSWPLISSNRPNETGDDDISPAPSESAPEVCAFHLLFGRTIRLDKTGRCWQCVTAPTDADNYPEDDDEDYDS